MARPKTKEYKPLSVRLDATLYERLEEYSKQSGQSKTVAIERALTKFIDDYEKKMKMLESIESNNG